MDFKKWAIISSFITLGTVCFSILYLSFWFLTWRGPWGLALLIVFVPPISFYFAAAIFSVLNQRERSEVTRQKLVDDLC